MCGAATEIRSEAQRRRDKLAWNSEVIHPQWAVLNQLDADVLAG